MNPITDIAANTTLLEKIKKNRIYAQNLYAAICNNDFMRLDPWDILNHTVWNCSWRMAGGYVADLRDNSENYLDFYCSGIASDNSTSYQVEGDVTEEVLSDLNTIGWTIVNPHVIRTTSKI